MKSVLSLSPRCLQKVPTHLDSHDPGNDHRGKYAFNVKLSFTSQRDVAELRRPMIANAQTNNDSEDSNILRFQRSDHWLPEFCV